MIKDMVLNLSLSTSEDPTIDYAVSLASAFDARLAGIALVYEDVPVVLGDGMSAQWVGGIEELRKEVGDAAKAAIARFEKLARDAGLAAESRFLHTSFSSTGDEFGRMARRFDLSVVRQAEPKSGKSDNLIIQAALFDSGRPVLIVPRARWDRAKFDRMLICWDGSRSAARAVSDAMPFLKRANAIDLITIGDRTETDEMPGANIADHLKLHGLKATEKRIVAPNMDVPHAILSHAADSSADLIVMGGYGHSQIAGVRSRRSHAQHSCRNADSDPDVPLTRGPTNRRD
jgi:nucleotide-binding universal stress UspA family protein